MIRVSLSHALAVCAVGLVSASFASAQVKVGVVNLQKAIVDTAEIKKAQADLEAKYKPRQDEGVKLQQDLQQLQTQLQSGKLSAQGSQDAQFEVQRKQRDLQRLQDDLQAEVNNDRQQILQRVGQRMSDIVKKIAEAKGLDLVIDTSNAVYFKPALEITPEATAEYDKAYPVK